MNSYWLITQFRNKYLYFYKPEDDPGKGLKPVALPPAANKKCCHSSVCFVLLCFRKLLCRLTLNIPLSKDTQQDAYHKSCKVFTRNCKQYADRYEIEPGKGKKGPDAN
jgi:hypothetical protein